MNWRLREYGWRFLPGAITALIIGGLTSLTVLQPLEQMAYRALFQLRGERPWDDRLVIIAIDDASLQELGRFPWPRYHYTQLLSILSEAQASIVVFDLIWSEASPDDSQLADAMAQQGRVVLAQAWDATGIALWPVPTLDNAAIATGHISQRQDGDGLVRHITPQIGGQPALGLAVLQAYGLVQETIAMPPMDRPLWVNWSGRSRHLPTYSFHDVLKGTIPPVVWENKIVLVGVTATGLDPLTTPFDRNPPASSVYLHAAVIDSVLQQTWLKPLYSQWFWLILLLGGPGLSGVMTGLSTRKQLATISILCFCWVGVGLLLFRMSYLPPMAVPLTLFVLTTGAVALSERLRENKLLQQQIQQLWTTYHQDLVVQGDVASPLAVSFQASQLQPPPMKRVEQLAALAEQFGRSQSTQAAIARSLSIGLVASDLEGRVWFCNPVATEWLAVEVGDDLSTRLIPSWLEPHQWEEDLQTLRSGKVPEVRELQRQAHWFELKLEPLTYQTTRSTTSPLDGFLLLLEIITPRKQIEENLNRQLQELNQLSLMKDDFLSTVSHELRAPLANITVVIQLLQMTSSAEERQQYMRILQEECNRETELIDDLLDLQRLEAKTRAPRLEPLVLQDWLPLFLEPFYGRSNARQLSIRLQCPSSLPPILSEQTSLRRILTELLNNACKYTPPHHDITVSAQYLASHIYLTVQNTGVEIPEAELPKIFDRFYRIPKSDRWKQGGTGLGLALVRKLVEHLHGTIQVTSHRGFTAFTVILPTETSSSKGSV